MDLSSDPLHIVNVNDFFLFKDFDGNLFTCQYVGPNLDLAKSPLAEIFANFVIANKGDAILNSELNGLIVVMESETIHERSTRSGPFKQVCWFRL